MSVKHFLKIVFFGFAGAVVVLFFCVARPSSLVSVVMPVYNQEKMLSRAVRSIQAQTYSAWELIIVDDGSTDETLSVARALAAKDARIRVIAAPHQGRVGARNRTLDAATGKYVLFQDSDDESAPDRMKRLVRFLEQNSQIDVVGSAFAPIGVKAPAMDYLMTADGWSGEALRLIFILGATPTLQGSMMVRRDFLEKNHIRYRADQGGVEELAFYEQIFAHGGHMANLPEALYHYRMHGDNPKSYYREGKEFAGRFFATYWNRFFPDRARPDAFCDRVRLMAEENKRASRFDAPSVRQIETRLCPDGRDLFSRSSLVLRINDEAEIVSLRTHDSTFWSYLMNQRGRFLFQTAEGMAVSWSQDKICGFYPAYWSDKWRRAVGDE